MITTGPELRPPLDAEKILFLVGGQPGRVGETNLHLIANALPTDLLEALERATVPLVRQIICDICGFARVQEALPALTVLLDDSIGVRGSAADAIGKIGAARSEPDEELEAAGVALLGRLHAETDPPMKRAMTVGLSGARYRPALPVLREAAARGEKMRGIAERAVGFMGAPGGNRWEGPSGYWDVHHPDGSHTYVDADGEVAHGPDNFPNGPGNKSDLSPQPAPPSPSPSPAPSVDPPLGRA